MNIGGMLSSIFYLAGFAGLLFVAFIRIHNKFCKRFIVHWKDIEDMRQYTIVKACTEFGAIRVIRKNPDVKKVVKVVKVVYYDSEKEGE